MEDNSIVAVLGNIIHIDVISVNNLMIAAIEQPATNGVPFDFIDTAMSVV